MRPPRLPGAPGGGSAAWRPAARPARSGRCHGQATRRGRPGSRGRRSGPDRSAALAFVSASTAVSPSAVTPIRPVQAGSPVDGIEQVVGVAAVGAAPDPHVQPRGGDGAGAEPQHIGAIARQRVLDEDLVGIDQRVGPAEPNVAAAIDDEARVAAQAVGDQVGRQALSGSPGVEPDPRRAGDRPGGVVDLELTPVGIRVGFRRLPRRSLGEGGAKGRARHAGPRGVVAGGLDLADQGRVDQAVASARRRPGRP